MTAKPLTLWSLRFSPAKGSHFVAERLCAQDSAAAWFSVFQSDEPGVKFVLAHKKPRV